MKLTPTLDSAALDALFEPYNRCDRPGIAVGVAIGGVPRYRRGFGVASIETGAALSPAIRMRIGSVSKHFTALAILLLEEDNKLSRDMSIRHFLPELGDVAAGVTLAHLMSNTSGLRCGHDLIWTGSGIGCTTTRDAPFEVMRGTTSANFAPGDGWSYCNGGFALLDRVVERVSGQDFGDFLCERIFAPIGMNDTLVRALDSDLVPNSATLHVPLASGGYRRGDFGIPIGGEGGIVSTVDDMLRWLRHMAAPVIGSAESWAAIHAPRSTHGYGFGLLATDYRGQRTLQHSGGVIGGVCQMICLPDADLDIIIIANSAGIDPVGLAEKIIDLSLSDLPAKPDGKVTLPVEGVFHSAASGRTLRLSTRDDIAMLDLAGTPLPLTALPGGAIGLANAISDLRITASGDLAIEIVEFGARDRLDRAEPAKAADPVTITGQFVCEEARITVEIRCEADEAPRADFSGPWGTVSWRLEPLATNLWATIFEPSSLRPGGILTFDTAGFRLSTIQTRCLRFKRS